ncbi:MAG: class B sortase [Candidatus Limiplasma sp.]|nr:class B sortase [Candidatus Limiplasma sp.]
MDSPKKKGTPGRALLYLLLCAGVAGVGYSGYQIYSLQAEYAKGQSVYEEIRKEMAASQPAAELAPASGEPASLETLASWPQTQAPQRPAAASVSADSGGAVPVSVETGGAAPGEPAQPISQIDFRKLRDINQDSVAWVTLEGTVMDYPVVQGRDNDFYLNHLFTGGSGKAGAIFMEASNTPDFQDRHTILFGHHMRDGSMFATLDKYRDQAFYDEHPTMTLYTPQGDYLVKWFAGRVISPRSFPIAFDSDDAFLEYVDSAVQASDFVSQVQASPEDRILTLCTCSYVFDDARYALMGILQGPLAQ